MIARLLAGKAARRAATETWRTTTLHGPPDAEQDPLPRVLLYAAMMASAAAVAQVLVGRAFSRPPR
jgi:hypothetical protein